MVCCLSVSHNTWDKLFICLKILVIFPSNHQDFCSQSRHLGSPIIAQPEQMVLISRSCGSCHRWTWIPWPLLHEYSHENHDRWGHPANLSLLPGSVGNPSTHLKCKKHTSRVSFVGVGVAMAVVCSGPCVLYWYTVSGIESFRFLLVRGHICRL